MSGKRFLISVIFVDGKQRSERFRDILSEDALREMCNFTSKSIIECEDEENRETEYKVFLKSHLNGILTDPF